MSHALYLNDPDGNGVGHAELGHVHLSVHNVAEADRFYIDRLGFELVTRFGNAASFVSVGGYHHHLGYNVWHRATAHGPVAPGSYGPAP